MLIVVSNPLKSSQHKPIKYKVLSLSQSSTPCCHHHPRRTNLTPVDSYRSQYSPWNYTDSTNWKHRCPAIGMIVMIREIRQSPCWSFRARCQACRDQRFPSIRVVSWRRGRRDGRWNGLVQQRPPQTPCRDERHDSLPSMRSFLWRHAGKICSASQSSVHSPPNPPLQHPPLPEDVETRNYSTTSCHSSQ